MLPRNVKWFAWIWLTTFLFGIFEIIFLLPHPKGVPESFRSAAMKLTIGLAILLLAILLPIFRLAVWGRKNWARWVLFLAFALSLPLLFVDRQMFQSDHLALTIFGFAGTLFEGVGFCLLFTGDARPWFHPQNSK